MSMDLEQALTYKLKHTAAIQALCSDRIYPQEFPPNVVMQAIKYQLISAPIEATHDEAAGASLAHPRYQVEAWAGTHAGAVALAKAIHTALHGFKGDITDGIDTFNIQSCLRVDKRSDKDAEVGLHWVSQDYIIWALE
jgi:hypothetical protein